MKRFISLLLCTIMICSMFVGCSNKSNDDSAKDDTKKSDVVNENDTSEEVTSNKNDGDEKSETKEPIIMKFAHAHPAGCPRDQSIQYFKEIVEEKTNGNIIVEVYPAGQLGKEPELVEAVKMGTIEAVRAGVFDATATELMVYTMPFLFENLKDFQSICRGPIADEIAEATKEVGITVTATGDGGGFRQWTNNVRPIKEPDDLKGLKMRTPPIDSIVQTMEALGANPVSVPYVETYMGLKTGVADGEENPIINIGTMKFYEVQKYITMANYQVHPDPVYVNTEWLESLPEDLKDIIIDCSKEMMEYSDSLIYEAEEKYMEEMKNSMEVTILSAEERQKFIDASKVVWDNFVDQGLIKKEHLDAILEELE
ncbi:ABC transporter substrate-binding protein [Vallitalea longa]|uniref:ABC transporter substrate-binding protein n=1 Tax=Vallitalea longa TaxID=2936439 RepID=A0A9W5YDA1_9FIRM|nr:TRAP transporter substrate-binding protein [Vallitalea longa]GKX29113.1 ABC transporter substrate-binding protein [Vallitalea longa]